MNDVAAETVGNVSNNGAGGLEEFLQGFLRVEKEVRAVPESALLSINLEVQSVVTTLLGAWPEIIPFGSQIAALPGFESRNIERLKDYTLALGYTHGTVRSSLGLPDGVTKLAADVAALREILLADATALAKRGFIEEARVLKLRSPSGYKNLAFDVVGLVQLLRDRLPEVAARTGVQASELEHAAQLAHKLVVSLGVREQQPVNSAAATVLRQQAFTLVVKAYEEVRQALAFIRRKEDDVESIAPSLWTGRGYRATAAEPTTEPAEATQPSAAAAALPVAPGGSPIPAAPPPAGTALAALGGLPAATVGLPGSSPLTRS